MTISLYDHALTFTTLSLGQVNQAKRFIYIDTVVKDFKERFEGIKLYSMRHDFSMRSE